ncbi:hypothetical protein [Komagataeibacter medellinensis]|nr:hypothetical protein [Komagataeibacter medellinensis]
MAGTVVVAAAPWGMASDMDYRRLCGPVGAQACQVELQCSRTGRI